MLSRLGSAPIGLPCPCAGLSALRRVDAPEPDALAVDLQRVPVDHQGSADDGRGIGWESEHGHLTFSTEQPVQRRSLRGDGWPHNVRYPAQERPVSDRICPMDPAIWVGRRLYFGRTPSGRGAGGRFSFQMPSDAPESTKVVTDAVVRRTISRQTFTPGWLRRSVRDRLASSTRLSSGRRPPKADAVCKDAHWHPGWDADG